MAMVYQYIMRSRFRKRIQSVVESFSSTQEDIIREKK
jgi:hypothetical protein